MPNVKNNSKNWIAQWRKPAEQGAGRNSHLDVLTIVPPVWGMLRRFQMRSDISVNVTQEEDNTASANRPEETKSRATCG